MQREPGDSSLGEVSLPGPLVSPDLLGRLLPEPEENGTKYNDVKRVSSGRFCCKTLFPNISRYQSKPCHDNRNYSCFEISEYKLQLENKLTAHSSLHEQFCLKTGLVSLKVGVVGYHGYGKPEQVNVEERQAK